MLYFSDMDIIRDHALHLVKKKIRRDRRLQRSINKTRIAAKAECDEGLNN